MRIAHLSDFHFTKLTWNPFSLFPKRWLAQLNWVFNRDKEFSPSQVDPLPDLFQKLGVDLVLLGGDFTTTALPQEFERAFTFASKLRLPWIAIPGNHDNYTKESFAAKRYYRYFPDEELSTHGVKAEKIGPNWWVVALDSSFPGSLTSSRGKFSSEREAHLRALLRKLPSHDFLLLFNHYPFFQNDGPHKILERGEVLEQIVREDPRIRLYLHGHTHRNTLADLQPSGYPIVLDSGSCTQGPQGSWNLIDLQEAGCTVSTYRWNRGWYLNRTEHLIWRRT